MPSKETNIAVSFVAFFRCTSNSKPALMKHLMYFSKGFNLPASLIVKFFSVFSCHICFQRKVFQFDVFFLLMNGLGEILDTCLISPFGLYIIKFAFYQRYTVLVISVG